MKIRINKADRVFSQYIRLRDGKCLRCSSRVEFNDKRLPVSHQASHYFGRNRESTRFDPDNVDTLCYGCHQFWGSDNREAYRVFKVKQLGENGFKVLTVKAEIYKKKDTEMDYIIAKELVKDLKNGLAF